MCDNLWALARLPGRELGVEYDSLRFQRHAVLDNLLDLAAAHQSTTKSAVQALRCAPNDIQPGCIRQAGQLVQAVLHGEPLALPDHRVRLAVAFRLKSH